MKVERRAQGATRRSILQLLRRHGQMSAIELSDALAIGAVGIRQHLTALEQEGLVYVCGLRRNVGRPAHLYALTERAEAFFPKHYERLVCELIDSVAAVGGEPAVKEMLEQRRKMLFTRLAPQLADKPRATQVAILAEALAEQGYMCECEQSEKGDLFLTQYNCPFDCVARRYPQICAQELRLYEDLLETTIERDTTIAEGGHCCRYRIPA
ncbi:helix-turn-helix transcriptional regulator [Chloroflexus sp.]|uniref:helix-turn-helix transcriptional regulator n=1 Tax=Chloroflexus sp. TaxID=1904827 RepID=UPI002ADD8091|nr:helix-turn-helix domain-containing protein [Chloroflexus sp.]